MNKNIERHGPRVYIGAPGTAPKGYACVQEWWRLIALKSVDIRIHLADDWVHYVKPAELDRLRSVLTEANGVAPHITTGALNV